MISLESRVVAAPGFLSADVAGETVILGLDRGLYYGLDAVGTRVWSLAAEARRVGDIVDVLVAEFDVEPARCVADVLALLGDMAEHGLVTVEPGG
jgi:hypothetical protein